MFLGGIPWGSRSVAVISKHIRFRIPWYSTPRQQSRMPGHIAEESQWECDARPRFGEAAAARPHREGRSYSSMPASGRMVGNNSTSRMEG